MSKEQFQNELNYSLSLKILKKMLDLGLITVSEFKKIDALNCVSFPPRLASIMA